MKNIFTFFKKGIVPSGKLLLVLLVFVLGGHFSEVNAVGINKSGTLVDAVGWNLSGYHILYASLTPTDSLQTGKVDEVFTLSQSAIAAWGDYSIAIRFSNWGTKSAIIDCRNGESPGFATVNEVPFEIGKKYHCWVETAVYDKKYSVYIQAEGVDKPVMIADQYAYRKSDITELTIWSSLYNESENNNRLEIEGLKLVNAVGEIPGSSASELQNNFTIKAYPNPANGAFTLETKGAFEYVIYNLSGAALAKGNGFGKCLLGAELTKGVYVLKVKNGTESRSIRIIKS